MRSLPKVIKTARLDPDDEVFRIPDDFPEELQEEPEEETGESEAAQDDPPPRRQESQKEREEEERKREEERLRREKRLEAEARQKAEELSQRILQSAKTEREKLLEQAQTEAGKIREEARQAGYQAAYKEKQKEIQGRLAELDQLMEKTIQAMRASANVMDRLQKDQKDFLRQYQEGLSTLALDIAQKLLDESIAQHQELMRPLVQKAVSSAKNTEWISVQVSDRLPGLAEELKKDLAGRPGLPPVDVIPGDGPVGTCVVHTPEGIVDASVSTQLENLKTLFEG